MVVAIAKMIGLSFTELNELSIEDLVDISRAYSQGQSGKQTGRRYATQADIDQFTGWKAD